MDLRTGKTYDTREAALADGAAASDVVEVTTIRDGKFWLKFENKKHPVRHQSKREMARRQKALR
jgi:hypothetical protein